MAEVRLIDANALPNYKCQVTATVGDQKGPAEMRFVFWQDIEKAPTIDAVPVVRCRECKHAIVNEKHSKKPLICCLTKMCGTTKEDWFCADGEREMEGGASDGSDA